MSRSGDRISSAANPRLKLVRRVASKNGRVREGRFAVEGEDLVHAGVRAGWRPAFVLVAPDVELPVDVRDALPRGAVHEVDDALLDEVSTLGHAARVLAVFEIPAPAPASPTGAIVWLDGVKDPGNVGTVLRSALAFGAGGVLLARGSADPYSPKATRASMGAVFSQPVATDRGDGTARSLGRRVVALDASGADELWNVELGEAPVLCIGSERTGLSKVLLDTADVVCRIPQSAAVESLNAAAVATLALYEWRRQLERGAGA